MTGIPKLQTTEGKSHVDTDSNAEEKDIFREIPLRYAGIKVHNLMK